MTRLSAGRLVQVATNRQGPGARCHLGLRELTLTPALKCVPYLSQHASLPAIKVSLTSWGMRAPEFEYHLCSFYCTISGVGALGVSLGPLLHRGSILPGKHFS